MGSDLSILIVGSDALADQAVDRITDLERRWSRFNPDSEVSRLNRSFGQPVEVGADTIELVRTARTACHRSNGLVDPTMLAEVIAAGYDRSFDQLPADRATTGPVPPPPLFGIDDIEIDEAASTIALPPGLGFDPGGIGKGLAADIVVAEALAGGAGGACVAIGGDVRVDGCSPDGDGWTIAIVHPHHDSPIVLVGVRSGAVASSTTLRRRWNLDGIPHHHLLDPRTRRPSTSPVTFASAVAATGWQAEAAAKASVLSGHPLTADGAETLTVDDDGTVRTSIGFRRFTGDAPIDPLPPTTNPRQRR